MFAPLIIGWQAWKLPPFSRQISVSIDTFDFRDKTPIKIFWHSEPPEVIRGITDTLLKNHKFYDLILTWDEKILSQCSNARLHAYGGVWARSADVSQKKFAASMITSSKDFCEGHRFRLKAFDSLPNSIGDLPISKYKSPPLLPTKEGFLIPFQYSVVMENAYYPNWFTEKINDAMATKTIPVYWGAPNIGKFYNADGILAFQTIEEMLGILASLTPHFYESKQAAIEENYQRSFEYDVHLDRVVAAINNFLETR